MCAKAPALVAAHEPAGSKWHYYAEIQAAVAAAIAIGNHHIVHTACMRARGRFPAPRSARADLPHDALDNPPPRDHSHVQDGAGGGEVRIADREIHHGRVLRFEIHPVVADTGRTVAVGDRTVVDREPIQRA